MKKIFMFYLSRIDAKENQWYKDFDLKKYIKLKMNILLF